VTQAQTVTAFGSRLRKWISSPTDLYGIAPFGIRVLDYVTGGIGADWNIILAGRPGCGKSSLAMQFAEKAAEHFQRTGSGLWVKVASLEMTAQECFERRVFARAGVNGNKAKRGRITAEEVERLERASQEVGSLPICYLQGQGTWREFYEFVADNEYPTGLWILDHVGLITEAASSTNNQIGLMKVIANKIKVLCHDKKKPGITICHTNREAERNRGHRPMLGNLGYADEFGKNADLVLAVHRPRMYEDEDSYAEDEPEPATILMLKHRHGEMAHANCFWFPESTTFIEASQVSPPESPGMKLIRSQHEP
jgi:replicative DNA helicase